MIAAARRLIVGLAVACGLLATAGAGEPNWPDHLIIGTASPGGTYYVYGEAMARVLGRDLDLPVARQATGGPLQNIVLLEAGDIQIGFVTTGIALQAWNGTGAWEHRPPARSMRVAFPMYDTPFQFMALRDSGIQSVADLAGKRVGIGPQGGTAASYAPQVFATLGIQASFIYGEYAELAEKMKRKEIDAFFAAIGVPSPAFLAVEATSKVSYLPLTSQQIAALRLAMPELTPSRVPAGSYGSLLRHYDTVGLYNFAVVRADLPDDLVYQMVKAVFDDHEELVRAHASAAATVAANIDRNAFLPLHPGAVRYYQQIGKAGLSD